MLNYKPPMITSLKLHALTLIIRGFSDCSLFVLFNILVLQDRTSPRSVVNKVCQFMHHPMTNQWTVLNSTLGLGTKSMSVFISKASAASFYQLRPD